MKDSDTKPFNPFEYFETPEERQQFLLEALRRSRSLFMTALTQAIEWYTPRKLAEISGLQREHLYKLVKEQHAPSLDTIVAIITALGSPKLDGFEPSNREEKEPVTT